MKIIHLSLAIVAVILSSGCTTFALTQKAAEISQSLTIESVEQAYIDSDNIYICFKGKGKSFSKSREPNITINYNDNILKLRLRKVESATGVNSQSVFSGKILDKTCGEINTLSNNLASLPTYFIETNLVCEPMQSCNSLEWSVDFENEVIKTGVIKGEKKYGDASTVNTLLPELKKEQKMESMLLVTGETTGRHYSGERGKSLYYYYVNNSGASKIRTYEFPYKNPIYPLYVFTPLTIAWDIATLPLQVILVIIAFQVAFMNIAM